MECLSTHHSLVNIRVLRVLHYRMVDCLFVCTHTKELPFFLPFETVQALVQWSNASHRKMVGFWKVHSYTSSKHLLQAPKHRVLFVELLLPS